MSRTILCVEDEQDTADLIRMILAREGYTAVLAADGRQAICLIETMLPPALILLDVVVPYVNGFELLAALRRNPDWQHVPIIMVSADYYQPDIQRALAEGANAYVVKTPGLQDLARTVNQVLSPPISKKTAEPPTDQVGVAAEGPALRRRLMSEGHQTSNRKNMEIDW